MTGVINPGSGAPPISKTNSGNITVKDVFDYVMNTPENTNPNVLKSMLNELSGDGGTSFLNALLIELVGSPLTGFTSSTTYDQIDQAYKNDNSVAVVDPNNKLYGIHYDGIYYIEFVSGSTHYRLEFNPDNTITVLTGEPASDEIH